MTRHTAALTTSAEELIASIKDCLHYAQQKEPVDKGQRARCFVAGLSGSTERRWPELSASLADLLDMQAATPAATANLTTAGEHFVTVPARTLPGGRFVESFQYAKYPCAKGDDGKILLSPSAKPWVNVTQAEAILACSHAGYTLARESQELAIRLDVSEQDINWTGGKVGVGKVFQGLHKGTVSGPQAANYVSNDPEERSWHQLSTGERVYGLAGNIYTRVSDDIQGDGRGVVEAPFASDSPSVMAAPFPSREKGMGWRPDAGADWSAFALVRGGCWNGGVDAGVFHLGVVSPDSRVGHVGFRCTK